jgi:hypothetical protein
MPKNPENINPIHEEVHEEEERLYKNDKQHNYIPAEQIPDPDGGLEPLSEEAEEYDDRIPEEETDTERQVKADKIKRDILATELKFKQGEGVASVGPDVGEEIITEEAEVPATVIDSERIFNPGKESMSPEKVAKSYESKKIIRRSFGKENLKTMSSSKKNRGLRAVIRRFLHRKEPDIKEDDITEDDIAA